MSYREPQIVTERVLARRLGVKAHWLREEALAGRLPHVPAGDHVLFDPQAVEQALLKRAQKGAGHD